MAVCVKLISIMEWLYVLNQYTLCSGCMCLGVCMGVRLYRRVAYTLVSIYVGVMSLWSFAFSLPVAFLLRDHPLFFVFFSWLD